VVKLIQRADHTRRRGLRRCGRTRSPSTRPRWQLSAGPAAAARRQAPSCRRPRTCSFDS
jgi:hypothetical protein